MQPWELPGMSQAGLKPRLAGARVRTCLGERRRGACLTPGWASQAPARPSGARSCACACVCVHGGGGECLPGHVGGWELWGCDLALLGSLWLPCGQFYF